jgi:thiol:disulfide interchange protein DsbD
MLHMHKSAHIRVFAALMGLLAASLWIGQPPAQAADAGAIAALDQASDCGDFLCVDDAFKVGVTAVAPDRIEVIFEVDRCCYLYRERFKFSLPEGVQAALGTPDIPAGEHKVDDLGEHQVFHEDVVVRLPVVRGSLAAFTLPLIVGYQGCNEPAGICYLPQTKTFQVAMPEATTIGELPAGGSSVDGYVSKQDWLAGLIRDGNAFLMVGAFLLAGLGLAFTPCVLPMVPIVAGLIAGQGAGITRSRSFLLSLAYVLGMAATYTGAGVAVAAAGQQAQTLFQQWWIILLFAALFVAMALSMFGFYTVQMPAAIQTRLSAMSNQQKSGSYAGVAVMGALSALIVTTCVGPALVAALSVIGQSGQMFRGGLALFSMAMGMGVPLLVVGASAGQLLPRAGAWMDTVKQVFGALMLAVAVWMLSRILPERVTVALWAIPPLALALILARAAFRTSGVRLVSRGLAGLALLAAVLMGVGAVRGATNPLHPLQKAAVKVELPFQRIKSLEDLNAQVAAANAAGKTAMLDFYADWCISCIEMEHYTFPKPEVREALANTVWLQADVTANDAIDQALLKHFGIYAPPSIMFFGLDGKERRKYRQVGTMKAREFAQLAQQALSENAADKPGE